MIGQAWKHGNVWSLLVLIGQKQQHKHTPHTQTRIRHKFCVQILATAIQKTTNQPPANSTQPEKRGGGHSSRETPGPIPNPEAKPARADGTALDRVWESRKPPHYKPNHDPRPKAGAAAFKMV